MESLFFNTPNQRYQFKKIFNQVDEYIHKVDISNGIFFYDISLKKYQQNIVLKNLDRMLMLIVVKSGYLSIGEKQKHDLKENSISLYASSRQDFSLKFSGEIFILFIADFFLKQYLSFDKNEPIDFLYNEIQGEVFLNKINHQPLDALSLYLIEQILHTHSDNSMKSLRCMHRIIEFISHRFSLLDLLDTQINKEELLLAKRAKLYLLDDFKSPPSIEVLAHLCATNKSKLKKVFKKVYKNTIYGYVQQLRLEEANLLLRENSITIGAVSKKVGYKHQGYFSKLFFKTYGVYPKDLLKS
jgi:AraC-like DNA-binding protein